MAWGGALWSASGYVSAFMQASNAIWDVEEGRPIWQTIPLRLGTTLVTVVLLAVMALAVVLTGPLAKLVGDIVGLGSTAVTVWDIAKWPVLILIVSFLFAFFYWASPNVRHPGFKWVSPGGLLGAEFNAEIERGRQIEAGGSAEKEPFLEPRDSAKS